jgi:5'-nucleotidase
MTVTTLRIAHFNDVYRVQPFKLAPTSPETIDVTQFAALLDSVRGSWPDRAGVTEEDGKPAKDGLTLFSGDVFSPSVESSVTRGSHMACIFVTSPWNHH